VVEEKEFFEQVDVIDVVGKDMVAQLKSQRDEVNQLYAKLIANPYLAPQLVPDFRSALMGTVATLMENGVPVSSDPKIRTPDDVIREGMAELGGMVGGKLVGGLMKMKQGFESSMRSSQEDEFTVYRDPDTGDYYYIDENGVEVDCDQHGNPLE
jgi:hypothetical protein